MNDIVFLISFWILSILSVVFVVRKENSWHLLMTNLILFIYSFVALNFNNTLILLSKDFKVAIDMLNIFISIVCGAMISLALSEIRKKYVNS